MHTTISLKQLRHDPREYIRLLKRGYEVAITEHRTTIVTAVQAKNENTKSAGDIQQILEIIETTPPLTLVDQQLDTISAVKQAKRDYLQRKYS